MVKKLESRTLTPSKKLQAQKPPVAAKPAAAKKLVKEEYLRVSASLYAKLLAAPSKGAFLGRFIRNAFPFRRITAGTK
jgi:hypothetical protein